MAAKPRPSALGRDGITVMLNHDRVVRVREVSQPTPADQAAASEAVEARMARLSPRSNRSARN
ncbi:MAG: hypothetical protein ACOX61_00540 [Brooklawnia sp.]